MLFRSGCWPRRGGSSRPTSDDSSSRSCRLRAHGLSAIRSYKQNLDNFKIQLGLAVDTHLVLDDRELSALRIQHPEMAVAESIRVALADPGPGQGKPGGRRAAF